ncbi:MAG: septum formation protein Maf [Deltaproteobacteria bacterium]|nr:septum formation protein Maf [Deltaproteobacteria bacterium]
MKQHCTVILGSSSPRRKELLQAWGIDCEIMVPVEGEMLDDGDPVATVEAIAKSKMASLQRLENHVYITADTIVHADGRLLGKPSSVEHAREMIAFLSGRRHVVSTAFVVAGVGEVLRTVHTQVWMQEIPGSWINMYLERASFFDKAGGYGIQEHAGVFVEKVEGSLTNVIGLPMLELMQSLEAVGAISF